MLYTTRINGLKADVKRIQFHPSLSVEVKVKKLVGTLSVVKNMLDGETTPEEFVQELKELEYKIVNILIKLA